LSLFVRLLFVHHLLLFEKKKSGYSYLNASIGFNFDAVLAGANPETIPIIVDKIIAKIINSGVIKVEPKSLGKVPEIPDSTKISQDLNDLNKSNHKRPIGFFLISPIMGFLGAIIGAILVYFLMSRITRTQQVQKKNTKIILNFLTDPEKKVIELLLNNHGTTFQYELNRIPGLSRVKTYRILQNLENKKIITKENFGKVNKVVLNKELFEVLKEN